MDPRGGRAGGHESQFGRRRPGRDDLFRRPGDRAGGEGRSISGLPADLVLEKDPVHKSRSMKAKPIR